MSDQKSPQSMMDLAGARSRYSLGLRIAVEIILTVLMALAVHTSLGFEELAQVFPLTATIAALSLSVANLAVDVGGVVRRRIARRHVDAVEGAEIDESDVERQAADSRFRGGLFYMLWLIGLVVVMRMVGALVGGAVFLAVFLTVEAKWRWWRTLIGVAVIFALLYELEIRVSLQLPVGYFHIIG